MLYNTFLSLIRPIINARGNSIIFPPESIEATVNLSVQQIYNEYKWMWLLVDEEINTFTDLTKYFVAPITYPQKYILGLEYMDSSTNKQELNPEHSTTQLNSTTFIARDQTLYVTSEQNYTLSYIRDYIFLPYVNTPSLNIPLPTKCIPALYYLVLSQLDMVDVQQLAGQPTANFNKYQYEIKNLTANDVGYEAQLIGGNPQ